MRLHDTVSWANKTALDDTLNLSGLFSWALTWNQFNNSCCPNFYLAKQEGENKNMQCLVEKENYFSLILTLPPSGFRKPHDGGEIVLYKL